MSDANVADDLMANATFTIPVRLDSPDRLANLLAVVRHLRANYSSRIIVGAEEPEPFRAVLPHGVEVVEVPNHSWLPFHHTRATNTMAWLVDTPVLVHIETDIVIPPAQLLSAVSAVLDDTADHVLPYDYAVDVRRHERSQWAAGTITADAAEGRTRWTWPVIGGCVVWRRDAFHRVGMENEHFIAWGLDDDERMVRSQALGARHLRVPGPLFHLEHERGPDSSARPVYAPSNEAELARIASMSPDELAEEVRNWAWVKGPAPALQSIEADDLTITVPVRIDTDDRLRNLQVAVRAVRAATTARVIVGVGEPSTLVDHLPPDIDVVAVDDPNGPFHRTRILNELALRARTPFVANLDADVVVPASQWADALHRLRGGADVVLPYDGTVTEVPFAHHPWLERGDLAAMPSVLHTIFHPASVGCCVVWRRSAFIEAGMENERFVSWGAEDHERMARATTLGLDVQRCPGPAFHLRHRRGPDSGPDNPMFAANEAKLQRIVAMDRETLRTEVAGWPWRRRAEESPCSE